MRRTPAILVSLSLAAVAASCGGQTPAVQGTPPPAAAGPGPLASPGVPVDLSEVAAPPGLLVWGRVAKPSMLLGTVHDWTQLPMPQSAQLTELLTSEAVGPLLDLDKPLELALDLTGSGPRDMVGTTVLAMSAAVADPEKAKATLSERYKLVPRDNGAILVEGLGRPIASDGDSDDNKAESAPEVARVCELAPAVGDASLRLICGGSSKALDDLGPWLTRSAPRAPTRSDVQLDLNMGPAHPTLRRRKRFAAVILAGVLADRSGLPGVGDLTTALGTDVVDFASDLEGLSFDLTMSQPVAQAHVTLRLSATTSALARVGVAHAERSGPAPAAFWQLPGDAESAFFTRGLDATELAKGADLLRPVVRDALAGVGAKPADAKAVVEAIGGLPTSAAVVFASGTDMAALKKASDDARAQPESAEVRRAGIQASIGWSLVELDESPLRLTKKLASLSAALASPSLAAGYRAKNKDLVPPSLRAASVSRSLSLPGGAVHYILQVHPRPGGGSASPPSSSPPVRNRPARPIEVHVFVVPEGARTWVGVGGNEALVAAHLATVLSSGGDKLATRADLAPLKEAIGCGGFLTSRSTMAWSAMLSVLGGEAPPDVEGALSQLPHQGATPIVFAGTAPASAATEAARSIEVRLVVPRDAVEDAVAAVLQRSTWSGNATP